MLSFLSRPSPGEANKDELDLQHKEAYEGRTDDMLILAPCIGAGVYNSLRDGLRQRGIPTSLVGPNSLSIDLTQFIQGPEPEAENEMYDLLLSHGLVLLPGMRRGEFHVCIPNVSSDLLLDILRRFDAFINSSRLGHRTTSPLAPPSFTSAGSEHDEVKVVQSSAQINATEAEGQEALPEDEDVDSETIAEPVPSRRGRRSVSSKAPSGVSDEEVRDVDPSSSSSSTVARSRAGRTPSKRKSIAIDESSDAGEVKTVRRRKAA
jgi:hypothetical protein